MKVLKDIRYKNQTEGFTITEVVVAALIFAIATAGILATASSMKKPAVDSSEDVTAAFLAKRILDDLRSQLDSETWNLNMAQNGAFSVGSHTMNAVTVGSKTYTPSYNVLADPNGTAARKINLKISWD
jgi:type II secretory pathway pseudopilin PulG